MKDAVKTIYKNLLKQIYNVSNLNLKMLLLVLFFFAVVERTSAQEAENIADLDFLYKSIHQLPSYKKQLKNDTSYQRLYERIRKDLKSGDEFEVYQRLLELIYPIKDNHLGFYKKPDSVVKFKYLKPEIDLAQMESKFKNYPIDSLEGVYFNPLNGEKLVGYKHDENSFYLQNLRTKMVEVILNRTTNGSIDAIRFLSPPVPYVLFRNVRLNNGIFSGIRYRKVSSQVYAPVHFSESRYEYKELEQGVGYLRLSSFNSSNENIKVATAFFNKISSSINPNLLIVDLRDNGGGGKKTSGQFADFIRKYQGRVFILQNQNTVSNAEQFIIDLKGKKNVTTLGETTRGTITYGSNYGKTIEMPSKRFLFYPTDMSGRSTDLAYENIGVSPGVLLDAFGEDWVDQTTKYIHNNK